MLVELLKVYGARQADIGRPSEVSRYTSVFPRVLTNLCRSKEDTETASNDLRHDIEQAFIESLARNKITLGTMEFSDAMQRMHQKRKNPRFLLTSADLREAACFASDVVREGGWKLEDFREYVHQRASHSYIGAYWNYIDWMRLYLLSHTVFLMEFSLNRSVPEWEHIADINESEWTVNVTDWAADRDVGEHEHPLVTLHGLNECVLWTILDFLQCNAQSSLSNLHWTHSMLTRACIII